MKFVSTLVVILAFATVSLAQEAVPLPTRIVTAARQQIGVTKEYDPAYMTIAYPGGDVPQKTGVRSDVVVRALRKVGIDLQKEVHEDMRKNFSAYPQKWGLKSPDKNIDHRRVPNLARYFERRHIVIAERQTAAETYRPGDIVTWDLGRGITHIGIVSEKKSGTTPLIIHNIGGGVKEEDLLFQYRVTGHYRIKENPPVGESVGVRPTMRAGTDRSATSGTARR